MRGAALATVVLVGACGGGSSPTTTPSPGNEDHTVAPTTQPCPSNDRLLADVAPATEIDACVPGQFGRPGWAIAARVTDEESMEATRYLVLVDTEHARIAEAAPEPIDPRSDAAPVAVSVADLDADGVDEVLAIIARAEGGIEEEFLDVWQVADQLVAVGTIVLRYASPDGAHCTTSFEIDAGRIVTRTETQNDPNQTCGEPGERPLRLLDGALVRDN